MAQLINVGLLAGLLEMTLLLVMPLMMLAYTVYLKRTWHTGLDPQARRLSVAMIVCHFAGLVVLVFSSTMPGRLDLEPYRLLLAATGIVLAGVVPTCLCAILVGRRLLPYRLRPYGWVMSVAAGLLSVTVSFAIWVADLALRLNAPMH